MLSDIQKTNWVKASTSLLCVFGEIQTTLFHDYNVQSMAWHVSRPYWKHASYPAPRNFHVIASACKVMATVSVFWNADGIVLSNCLEHGSTVTETYYTDLIRNVWAALKKRRGKLHHGVLFHQDNAPAHTSSEELAAVRYAEFELLLYPTYSPDLAPSDYYLFPKPKKSRKETILLMKKTLSAWQMTGWSLEEHDQFFYNGIQALEKCCTMCIWVAWDYVEKWQNMMYIFCLIMLFYKLFECSL